MADEYRVTHTQPYTYQSPELRLINGYRVYFVITQYNETFFIDVPFLQPDAVKAAIAPIVSARKALGG